MTGAQYLFVRELGEEKLLIAPKGKKYETAVSCFNVFVRTFDDRKGEIMYFGEEEKKEIWSRGGI